MGSTGAASSISSNTTTAPAVKLSPTSQQALELAQLWVARAQESATVEEFLTKFPRSVLPEFAEQYVNTWQDLKNGIVYSGERRFNKGAMNNNRLFTAQAAKGLVKAGLAEIVAEYKDGTVDIRLK